MLKYFTKFLCVLSWPTFITMLQSLRSLPLILKKNSNSCFIYNYFLLKIARNKFTNDHLSIYC
ncbi:hypothetical protein HZS_1175 [Henneguya salminicola]|nr:hypothetical protein HZS_1175 [Henneguya salminicola]